MEVQQNFTIRSDAIFNQTALQRDPIFSASKKATPNALWPYSFNSSVLTLSINSTEECWEYIGRYVYLYFWLHVIDLGQISPTPTSDPTTYNFSASENIFANGALYQNYLNFWNLNSTLDDYHPLNAVDTRFMQSYACQQRQLKPGLNLIISVIAADYAFLVGGYSLIIFVAGIIQKRSPSRKDGTSQESFHSLRNSESSFV